MAAMTFHTWKAYLYTRHTTVKWSGTAFQKGLKRSQYLWNNTFAGVLL